VGVNSLPKTVTRQRPGCDLNLGSTAPESSTLTTRLPTVTWSICVVKLKAVSINGSLCKCSLQFPVFNCHRLSSLSEQSKSALTDHGSHENHVINWSDSTIILDRESDRGTRWIKEAVHIGKEGQRSMNRDEGSYTLSHTYDRFLATSHHYSGKNRKKNWTTSSSDEGLW